MLVAVDISFDGNHIAATRAGKDTMKVSANAHSTWPTSYCQNERENIDNN